MSEELKYAIGNLKKRKLRTFLSVISITIGITSIFAIVSFGLGLQSYVNEIAAEAGVDKLFIQSKGIGAPGTDLTFSLSKEDINFIDKIKGVNQITGVYAQAGEIEHNKQKRFVFIMGIDTKQLDFIDESFTATVEKGRHLKKGDIDKVALGYNYQLNDKIFKKKINIGDKVNINSNKFEVIGFYEELGNPQDDSNIYLTRESFEEIYPDIEDKFGFLMIRADKNVKTADLSEKITEKFRKHKDQKKGEETFFVQTFEDALKTFGDVLNVLNGVLFLIALISLIVATVNIMNTMFTAVMERTTEIGIMKSIGAKNSTILKIFMFESGIIGLIGGVTGITIGFIIASIGGNAAAASGFSLLKPIFPFSLIFGCLLFALITGIIAGYLPSRKASNLKPVDALRYE